MSTKTKEWDGMTETLVAYAESVSFDRLPADAVHQAKRRLIDTFASALGAYEEPLAQMSRKVAARSRGEPAASVWGSSITTSPEAAAFANGVMVRLLDISDTYLGKSRGHPSDMTSGLVAVAQRAGADGKSLLAAIVLAYDVYCSFCKAVDINSRGWDQPVYSVLGCVLGAAKLLGLTREETANAIALALAPNMALAQSRRGHLSSWKGCAGANASRNAVFAATLAQDGFTGPAEVFEGDGGLFHAIGKFDWPLPEGGHMIGETHIKALPVCYHGQSPVEAAIGMQSRVDPGQIETIEIDTYATAVMMMGADPSRWAPKTRETADHSLPYCVSVALLDGKVTNESFSDARLADPAIARLMAKVKVLEDAKLSALYPDGSPGRVTLRMQSGETLVEELRYPKGHAKSVMTDAEVEAKFRGLAGARLGERGCDAVLRAVWQLDEAKDVGRELVALLAPGGVQK